MNVDGDEGGERRARRRTSRSKEGNRLSSPSVVTAKVDSYREMRIATSVITRFTGTLREKPLKAVQRKLPH